MRLLLLLFLTLNLLNAQKLALLIGNSDYGSISNIEGRYDLISMTSKPTEYYKNNPSYQKQYNYLAGTMIIKKLDDNRFGYYYATKIKDLSPNRFYGMFKIKDGIFVETRFSASFEIESDNKQRWKMIYNTSNIIETSLWKKVNSSKKISPYLRRILSKTKKEVEDNNWVY